MAHIKRETHFRRVRRCKRLCLLWSGRGKLRETSNVFKWRLNMCNDGDDMTCAGNPFEKPDLSPIWLYLASIWWKGTFC